MDYFNIVLQQQNMICIFFILEVAIRFSNFCEKAWNPFVGKKKKKFHLSAYLSCALKFVVPVPTHQNIQVFSSV